MLDIFLVQMEVAPNDKAINFAKVEALTRDIRKEANDPVKGLIVLPEMFSTGYLPLHPERAAEDFSSANAGETACFLHGLARQTGCVVMGSGIGAGNAVGDNVARGNAVKGNATRGNAASTNKLTNHTSVYTAESDREFAHYNKRKPFFMEQGKFGAGQEISLFKISDWQIAPTVCFDLRFPEIYRDAVKLGANLFTVQAAWPEKRVAHWNALLKARAIENQAFVAGVNCISSDKNYTGNSQIINPLGEVIAQARASEETVISAQIDSEIVEKYRKEFPVLEGI